MRKYFKNALLRECSIVGVTEKSVMKTLKYEVKGPKTLAFRNDGLTEKSVMIANQQRKS